MPPFVASITDQAVLVWPEEDNCVMTPSESLAKLAADYWEGVLRRNPTTATFFGDYRWNDRLPEVGPDGRAAEERDLKDVQARLDGISRDGLTAD